MRVAAARVIVCSAVLAMAAVAVPSLAGAKLFEKKKVRTEVTLIATLTEGKTYIFDGSLNVKPVRKTCLRREVTLVGGKPDNPKVIATDSSDSSGNFDLGIHKTKKGETFQAFAEKKVKKRKKQGKKIVCKPGQSEALIF